MIVAEKLTKRLGRVRAIQCLDLSVTDGEKVTIFGPNGAGKSTLLRLVAGLLRPTSGTVTIDGRDPRLQKARLGYLGHEPFLYGHLTPLENLEFFSDLYGVNRREAARSLERLQIAHRADARVNELSQGEVRRVGLARAVLHDPRLLLLDEPFSNLDDPTADLVQTLLREPGRTVLLVTHDRDRGLAIGDRSILLKEGSLATGVAAAP